MRHCFWWVCGTTQYDLDGREEVGGFSSSLRANGSRQCAPDDRLREAIQLLCERWIASSLTLLAMTQETIIAALRIARHRIQWHKGSQARINKKQPKAAREDECKVHRRRRAWSDPL